MLYRCFVDQKLMLFSRKRGESDRMTDDPGQIEDPGRHLKTGGGQRVLAGLRQADLPSRDSLLGRELSGYRIDAHLADGGMSRVYRAHRADGRFDRDVAIKISAGSIIDAALRDRFFREQRILATLNHPCIAQLYDAGITEEGWPYIVMELIDGLRIDEYCAGVDTQGKLILLTQICSALTFAHSRLVVHRDIKPSNVLVSADGQPKLLDFGIAKLLSVGDLETRTLAMTPRYASPEQLLGQAPSVATDIYQVGLLMAHLLHPDLLQRETDLERAISRAASSSNPPLNREIARTLPRELVHVVEQCVRAEPTERYTELSDVREELENYLNGYPVRAIGNSRTYRTQKFVRRNALALAATVAAMAAFVASGTWYLMAVNDARQQAELEASAAQSVTDFLVEVFSATDPSRTQGEEVSAKDVLDQGLQRLQNDQTLSPSVEARLYGAIGAAHAQLGFQQDAEPLLRRAVTLHEQSEATGLRTLAQKSNLADTLRNLGQFEEAVSIAEEALNQHERHHLPDAKLRISLINSLAASYQQWGKLEEAEAYYQRGNEFIARHGVEAEDVRAWFQLSFGHLLNLQGKGEEAVEWMKPVYERAQRELGPDHPATLAAATNVGHGLHIQGRHEEAFPMFQTIYEGRLRTLGPDHAETLAALANVGTLQLSLGRFAPAEAALGQAVTRLTELHGPEHPITLHVISNHGQALTGLGRYQQAIAVLTENLAVERRVLGNEHPYTIDCQRFLAAALVEAERWTEATEMAMNSLPLLHDNFGAEHPYTIEMESLLARSRDGR
jgi:serine/threonine-protein kinase